MSDNKGDGLRYDILASVRSIQGEQDAHELARQLHAARGELRSARKRVRRVERDLAFAEERAEVFEVVDVSGPGLATRIKVPKRSGAKPFATAVTMWSDLHVEEVIDADTIGLNCENAYTPDDAEEGIFELARRVVKQVDRDRIASTIEDIVVCLGGDLITGHIHPELVYSTAMTPTETIVWLEPKIAAALEHVADRGGFRRVIVPALCGNHGRTTTKPVLGGSAWKMSYEYVLYQSLARRFADHPVIEVMPSKSHSTTIEVYGLPLRFSHGDQIRYGSGVGGLSIPGSKLFSRMDQAAGAPTYRDWIGHWHAFSASWGRCIVNGSLIGYSAYAARFGFPFEPPIQAYALYSSKYQEEVVRAPIFPRGRGGR